MMHVLLLFPDRDPEWKENPDPCRGQRFADLELGRILDTMSGDDPVIRKVCETVLDMPLQTEKEILYRQEILKDAIARPDCIRKLYEICLDAEKKRKSRWFRLTSPHLSTVYSSAEDLLAIYLDALEEMRETLKPESFQSRGLQQFQTMLRQEISEEYLAQARRFRRGTGECLISSGFGSFLQGVGYVYRRKQSGFSRLKWLTAPGYTLADRDMNGEKDLEVRRDRAINEVANALAQAADSLESFLSEIRREAGFYIGALNLYEAFAETGVCFPEPEKENSRLWDNLYDGSLALLVGKKVVGNTLKFSGKDLIFITGANQGGKTTFLRSVGQCQMMAQCGLFVCAEACRFPLKKQLFTHFKREEDEKMDSGKLDEELARMSAIIDRLKPGSVILFNESFASTNEREGSRILSQITRALTERKIEVYSVTHLLTCAMAFAGREDTLYLRAQRSEAGERTYRMEEKMPLKTAFGEDIYRQVFGEK